MFGLIVNNGLHIVICLFFNHKSPDISAFYINNDYLLTFY